MNKHKKQFAIMRVPVEKPGFQHRTLADGWIFSYDEQLPFACSASGETLLIGYAWSILPDHLTPAEEIQTMDKTTTREQIFECEQYWCGRYVLIHCGDVYLDTSGFLGVFTSECGISSDMSLLVEAAGLKKIQYVVKAGSLLNWFPGPMTYYKEIRRVLPGQIYHYTDGTTSSRPLLPVHYEPIQDEEKLIRRFADLFSSSLRNMVKIFPDWKLLVALTGGYDSRVVFALARYAGLDFEAFTLEHPKMLECDLQTPPILCEKTGVKFTFFPRDEKAYTKEREEEYVEHIASMADEKDRYYYAYGQYKEVVKHYGKCVMLRGNGWENVQEYYRKYIGAHVNRQAFYNHYGLTEDCVERRSFEAFWDYCEQNPQPIDDCNRYFWEQMCGCWASETEHGFQLYDDCISIQPVNNRMFMAMLMNFPREERIVKYHQKKIAETVCPEIVGVPVGGTKERGRSFGAVLTQKLSNAKKRLQTTGVKGTLETYGRIMKEAVVTKRAKSKNQRGG